MIKKTLIYRKSIPEFNSIENVFNALIPFLQINKVELPYSSLGIINRLKNILYIRKKKNLLNHITGSDHYLAIGLSKKNTILTIHDIEFIKRSKGLKKFVLKKLWIDWPIKNSTIVTTISKFSKNEILNLNNYKTPIKVIHNPLTLPLKFTPKKFNSENPTILHIGVKQNKNLDRLIHSLEGIKCHLNIVGKSNPQLISKLEENKISYTIKTNLSNNEMMEEYYNCDMLAFVSTYEGFGLPIIEAQAVGCPVITSNISSMPEVAGKGAFLVDPFSTHEIHNGIKELINNESKRDQLIQKGLENVKRFDPKKIAKEYSNLYQEVLNAQ